MGQHGPWECERHTRSLSTQQTALKHQSGRTRQICTIKPMQADSRITGQAESQSTWWCSPSRARQPGSCPKCADPQFGGPQVDESQQGVQSPGTAEAATVNEHIFDVRYTIRRNESEQRRLRRMILELAESSGVTQRELARRIGIPLGTFTRWIQTAKQERGDQSSSSQTE